jgi:hypothetical protein
MGLPPPPPDDLLRVALPLAAFLEGPNGRRHADAALPQLVELLERLPAVWAAPHQDMLGAQADCMQLLVSVRR